MKAIRNIFITVAFFSCLSVFAQSSYQWAENAGGTSSDAPLSVTIDHQGNIYETGYFQSYTVSVGSATLTNVGSGNHQNFFVAKYDNTGNALWAQSAGGTDDDQGSCIITDKLGNIYVVGYFWSTTITFGTITLTNHGGADLFIVKYDQNGNVIWAQNSGGVDYDYANAVTVDKMNNIYVTGSFWSPSITLDTITITNPSGGLPGPGSSTNIYVAKYTSNGNVLWAKSIGSFGYEEGRSICTDSIGNVFVAGEFNSSVLSFGSVSLVNTSSTWMDAFLVKYDPNGNAIWAKCIDGGSDDYGVSIATDNSGVYLTGYSYSPILVFGADTLRNNGSYDSYVAKYDLAGNSIWANNIGGAGSESGWGIVVNSSGIYVAGEFTSANLVVGTNTITNSGGNDCYLMKYDLNGGIMWAKDIGGSGNENSYSLARDSLENVYISGVFSSSSLSFDATTLINNGSAGTLDMFLAKLGPAIGIEELHNDLNFVVAPNPFNSQTTLIFSKEQKNLSLNIYDVLGNKVRQYHFNGNNLLIEKNDMKPGMYLLQLIDEKKDTYFRKVIIE